MDGKAKHITEHIINSKTYESHKETSRTLAKRNYIAAIYYNFKFHCIQYNPDIKKSHFKTLKTTENKQKDDRQNPSCLFRHVGNYCEIHVRLDQNLNTLFITPDGDIFHVNSSTKLYNYIGYMDLSKVKYEIDGERIIVSDKDFFEYDLTEDGLEN